MARSDGQCGLILRWCRAAAAGTLCLLSSVDAIDAANTAPNLILRAGFEEEAVVPSGKEAYDKLLVTWPSGVAGKLPILYEAGTLADRFAQVITDPTQAGNQVLQFWLKNGVIPAAREGYYKGRIQLNVGSLNETFVYQRMRMYLHPDLAWYRDYPKGNNWFVISEFWSGDADDPYPFKISLNLAKDVGIGKPLYFRVTGDIRTGGTPGYGKWESIWSRDKKAFEVPVGEWLDVELAYLQGDAQTGRFYLAVKRVSDPAMTVIFNVKNWTYHSSAPQPVPLTAWQPLKLYTSSAILDNINQYGGVAQIYWDDLEIWGSR